MPMKLEEDRREREFWEKPGTKTQPCLLATAVLTNGAPQIALYFRKGFLERPQATKPINLCILTAVPGRRDAAPSNQLPLAEIPRFPLSQGKIPIIGWQKTTLLELLKIRAIFLFLVTDTIQRLFKRLRNQTRCPIRREMGE